MAQAFTELDASGEAAALTHADWLGLLLDRELTYRRDKRLAARLRYARLRQQATVDDVDYRAPRGLDRALFQKLANGEWIDAHDNLILWGAHRARDMMRYLVILLETQAFLPRVGRYCTTILNGATHRRPIKVIFADHVRRADADLPGRQQLISDQANNGHLTDAQTACRFVQNELTPLGSFAFAIDSDLILSAKVTHPQLGPGMPFGRADAEPVENRSDALVRHHASKFADQLLGGRISLPAMLAAAVFHHLQPCVFAALPMQHQT
jgi:hypothetical protein